MQTPEISLTELREDNDRLQRMATAFRILAIQLGEEANRTGARLDAAEAQMALYNKHITALKVAS